jgi:hypothetical protein
MYTLKHPNYGNEILIAENDFEFEMNWNDAQNSCIKLGEGWRLPTKNELNEIFKNKLIIGGFKPKNYWTLTDSNQFMNPGKFYQHFYSGSINIGNTMNTYRVRAVKGKLNNL